MTNREFYTAIVNGEITEDVVNHAAAALEKLDATNEKRRNTPSKVQIENQPLIDQIVNEILTAEPKTASDVATELGVKVQKASALLRMVVAAGKAVQGETKVPKKGVVKTYALAE